MDIGSMMMCNARWYCAAVTVSPDRVIMVSGDSWESMKQLCGELEMHCC